MKLAIFGATGRTGKYLLSQALAEGHAVTALVRIPERINETHPQLKLLQGDVRDEGAVSSAVAGAEAVLSTLAPGRGGPTDVMARGAENIVSAMQQHGVRRLVFTAGAGVPAPQDRPNLISKVMGFLVRTLSRQVYEDVMRSVEVVQNSGLDWTIARGPMLVDAPHNGRYQVGFVGNGMNPRLSRGNFADFVLKQAQDDTYLHQLPAVSDS